MRHPILGVAALACVAASVPAQRPQPSQEQLTQLRSEKLAKPVFQKTDWTFDYDAARERAREEGKLIFAYFTRSYAH